MIDALTLPPLEPIYIFVDPSGHNINIAASRLRQWYLDTRPEIFLIPVNQDLAASFPRHNLVNLNHCRRLTHSQLREPIIHCYDGTFTDGRPDVLMVDGHHRYVRRALDGHSFIKSWVLTTSQWHPFRLYNVPDTTEAGLRSLPFCHHQRS